MREVDEDESGEIDFAEFLAFMVNVKRRADAAGNSEPDLYEGMTNDEKQEAIAASVRKKLFDEKEREEEEEEEEENNGGREKKVVPWKVTRVEAQRTNDALRPSGGGDGDDSDDDLRDFLVESTRTFQGDGFD